MIIVDNLFIQVIQILILHWQLIHWKHLVVMEHNVTGSFIPLLLSLFRWIDVVFRLDPDHLQKYSHPNKPNSNSNSVKEDCRYGNTCTNHDSEHRQRFRHPHSNKERCRFLPNCTKFVFTFLFFFFVEFNRNSFFFLSFL